jgi:uncharacterized protein
MNEPIIYKTEKFVKDTLQNDTTGHDWHHIHRVRENALYIAKRERVGDLFVIEMAALLHDISDEKLNATKEAGVQKLYNFLTSLKLEPKRVNMIIEIINSISFKGGNGIEALTIEAKIVQDADRLDAIGAIGIARTFTYGGSKKQPMYDPDIRIRNEMTENEYRNGKSSSIHHFYEKLLKLKELLNTETARQMAEDRHQFMESFLQQFYYEWNGPNEITSN